MESTAIGKLNFMNDDLIGKLVKYRGSMDIFNNQYALVIKKTSDITYQLLWINPSVNKHNSYPSWYAANEKFFERVT